MTTNNYLEIARDVARIIHTKSGDDGWGEKAKVQNVLLFGSTLRESQPNDIDLLILHNGGTLKEFYDDPYAKKQPEYRKSDKPVSEHNDRPCAIEMLEMLGHNLDSQIIEGKTRHEAWEIEKAVISKDSAYVNVATRVAGITNGDKNLLEKLFDLHALSTSLFIKPTDGMKGDWWARRRNRAITSCEDPTFWHTVLTSGKIYDLDKHDFTIKLDDKYPGTTDLFLV